MADVTLLKELGLGQANHWTKVSGSTKVYELPSGLLIYLKESRITSRESFWGVEKEVIDKLAEERPPWKVVLVNESKRTGYVIDSKEFLRQIAPGPVSQNQYKIYEGAPKLEGLEKLPFDKIRGILQTEREAMHGIPWSRNEVVLALALYKETGPSHDDEDQEIRELAGLIGRTPAAVVFKLGNLRAVETGGKAGLTHVAPMDERVWREFEGRETDLYMEAERIRGELYPSHEDVFERQVRDYELRLMQGDRLPADRFSQVRVRQKEEALRKAVLANYQSKCAFCDLDLPELLEVAHIRRWADDAESQLSLSNALCLCVLHHSAFDNGFIAILPDRRLRVSRYVARTSSVVVQSLLISLDSKQMRMPVRHHPSPEFLAEHFQRVFRTT